MRILLDECVPARLRKEFTNHQVVTVKEMGWSGKKNGELLRVAINDGFEGFVTVDQNLQYQQNLQDSPLAIIVLAASTNKLSDLVPLMPRVLTSLGTIKAGEIVEIKA